MTPYNCVRQLSLASVVPSPHSGQCTICMVFLTAGQVSKCNRLLSSMQSFKLPCYILVLFSTEVNIVRQVLANASSILLQGRYRAGMFSVSSCTVESARSLKACFVFQFTGHTFHVRAQDCIITSQGHFGKLRSMTCLCSESLTCREFDMQPTMLIMSNL